MTELMRKIAESKKVERRRLAALPFSEKVEMLENLRDRQISILRSSFLSYGAKRMNGQKGIFLASP